MTVSTTAPVPQSTKGVALPLAMAFPFAAVFWLGQRRRTAKTAARKWRQIIAALLLVFSALICVSCSGGLQGSGGGRGGSGSPGTPTGTYNVTVSAASGWVTHSTQVSLTVTP
jgi:hypothetical protein